MDANPPVPWPDHLLKTLCELLRQYGVECNSDGTPIFSAKALLDEYQAQGVPTFGSASEKSNFLANLSDLRVLLDDPANNLPSSLTSDLKAMIASLQKQIG